MVLDLVTKLRRDLFLQRLNFVADKFDHFSALDIHHVIVVRAFVQLVISLATLKIMLYHQAGRFELVEHAVHCGKSDVLALTYKAAINVVGGHVFFTQILQNIENSLARMRDFQAGPLEIFSLHLNIVSLRIASHATNTPYPNHEYPTYFHHPGNVLSAGGL